MLGKSVPTSYCTEAAASRRRTAENAQFRDSFCSTIKRQPPSAQRVRDDYPSAGRFRNLPHRLEALTSAPAM